MEPRFDTDTLFGEDYLYFSEERLSDQQSKSDVDVIWRLLELEPEMEVLDLACGHGRISNRLAARGCRVTGLDVTPLFLERAYRDAADLGVQVEYVEGDMRSLPWSGRFDRVVNWFTAFGYFDDEENKRVLRDVHRALRPGGRFLIENNNLAWVLLNFRPGGLVERGDDLALDVRTFDARTSRLLATRVVVRDGALSRAEFSFRMLMFPELRDWLLAAGFTGVDGFGREGDKLTVESPRLLTIARKGGRT